MILAALLALVAPDPRVAAVLADSPFSGYALVVRGGDTLHDGTVHPCPPMEPGGDIVLCHPRPRPGEVRWPWASVSKQMAALVTMQQVERGRLRLDDPISRWIRMGKAPAPTVRQLLQHQSGFRNPNDSPVDPASGMPSFYITGGASADWCLKERKAPGGNWSYNNCDTIVLDRVLQRATGKSVKQLFAEGVARPLKLPATGYLSARDPDEPLGTKTARLFAGWGAGGALAGPPHALLAIDRALMAGRLLKPASRAEMWKGDPKLGYMALGQWVFDAPLKGCAKPVRIVERRGSIDDTQVRNIMVPEKNAAVILFTNVAEDKFDFGEIWQGRGLSHDLLGAAVCA